VRSLATFRGVPVLCVQFAEAGAGIGSALDRLVKRLGGRGFVDLRATDAARLSRIVGAQLREDVCGRPERRLARERLCILIIDHDVDAAQRLGELLEQAGHDVDFAYNAAAGMDAARRLRPDVVFLDLAVPHSDGYRLVGQLRAAPDLRNAVVIALACAPAGADDLARMREAGFDHHVVKPGDRRSISACSRMSFLSRCAKAAAM
jgi:CheY-like chemotaxis protein